MDIDDCEAKYKEMAVKIFGNPSWIAPNRKAAFLTNTPTYSAEPLEEAVKSIIDEVLKNSLAPMMDPNDKNPQCKVCVVIQCREMRSD